MIDEALGLYVAEVSREDAVRGRRGVAARVGPSYARAYRPGYRGCFSASAVTRARSAAAS
jgi:hypothetical protein